jgi:hypothetical protein
MMAGERDRKAVHLANDFRRKRSGSVVQQLTRLEIKKPRGILGVNSHRTRRAYSVATMDWSEATA